MKKTMIFLILASFILPIASADVIMPGEKVLEINNYLENIEDFPEYDFIRVCLMDFYDKNISIWNIDLIKEDGEIPSCYKFCSLDVYAINKGHINLQRINLSIRGNTNENLTNYFNSLEKTLVLDSIEHYKTVPISSTQDKIDNYYTISLEKAISKPENRDVERNSLIYYYTIIPLVAAIILVMILIKRKR